MTSLGIWLIANQKTAKETRYSDSTSCKTE